jgi:hypothetical protein
VANPSLRPALAALPTLRLNMRIAIDVPILRLSMMMLLFAGNGESARHVSRPPNGRDLALLRVGQR